MRAIQSIKNIKYRILLCYSPYVEPNPSSNAATKVHGTIKLDHSANGKATAAKATWLFKVVESDMSLRDCDGYHLLFKHYVSR